MSIAFHKKIFSPLKNSKCLIKTDICFRHETAQVFTDQKLVHNIITQ